MNTEHVSSVFWRGMSLAVKKNTQQIETYRICQDEAPIHKILFSVPEPEHSSSAGPGDDLLLSAKLSGTQRQGLT